MKITGILPLRNGVALGYPFELAIRSLRDLCDEVIVGVDPTSDDDTLTRVRGLGIVDRVVESVWDMGNHDGHRNCEISVQTQRLIDVAEGDWIFSLQGDELLHEDEVWRLRDAARICEASGVSAVELLRLYFFGGLDRIRSDWTLWMVRFFRRGSWRPDVDGAMRFDPIGDSMRARITSAHIWHYSRIGDPQLIAERVRNLDQFFHAPGAIESGPLPPYDFSRTMALDSYVLGREGGGEAEGVLQYFDSRRHPKGIEEAFGG